MTDFNALPITVRYVGKTKRDEWDCFQWAATFKYKGGEFTVDYFAGLAHADKRGNPKKPTNKDIMYALLLDASATQQNFTDWCADLGYSDDSLKALNLYKQCIDTATRLRKVFTPGELETMRTELEDY